MDDCQTHLEGGGCALPRPKRPCEGVPEPAPCTGCGDTGDSGVVAHYEGGGSACDHGAVAPSWTVALVLAAVLGLRRWRWLVVGLLAAGPASAADLEAFDVLDGAPVPGLVEPSLGRAWSPRIALTGTLAADPVRVRMGPQTEAVVEGMSTGEAAVSLQVLDWFVVGVDLPVHHAAMADPRDSGGGLGPTTGFFRAPLGARGGASHAFESRLQLPTGRNRALADDPTLAFAHGGSFSAGWVGARTCEQGPLAGFTCPWWGGGRVAARFQPATALGGIAWGSRWEASAGLRRNLGPVGLAANLIGSAPLNPLGSPTARWPLEANGFLSARAGQAVLSVGGGAGLSRGLGAPQARLAATLTWLGQIGDRDGDGYLDPRDLCPRRPEDRDRFRDGDGCPDLDNDQDGIADVDDQCPLEPEVFNDWKDRDGCPDALATWTVSVVSREPLERVWISVGDQGGWQVLPSGRFELEPGEHTLEVRADGHAPVRQTLVLEGGAHHTDVALRKQVWSAVRVQLVSADDGEGLAGTVTLRGVEHAVRPEGTPIPALVGRHVLTARADGFVEGQGLAVAPRDEAGELVLELDPLPPLTDRPPVVFALGSADLSDDGLELIDTLVAWLSRHPEIEVLRIEGHADEIGGSAYNLDLSERRAQTVADALVARGIAPERLRTAGLGEARAWVTLHGAPPEVATTVAGQALREVAFRVLVWNDAVVDVSREDHAR